MRQTRPPQKYDHKRQIWNSGHLSLVLRRTRSRSVLGRPTARAARAARRHTSASWQFHRAAGRDRAMAAADGALARSTSYLDATAEAAAAAAARADGGEARARVHMAPEWIASEDAADAKVSTPSI